MLIGIGYLLLNTSGRGNFKFNWDWRATKDSVQNGVADRMQRAAADLQSEAQQILQEVMREGDGEQQAQAQQLLEKLG